VARPVSPSLTHADERRAWGWVGHLRAGGTTPWAQWSTAGTETGRFLPGAQQLELLRRLNAAAPSAVPADLVDRVLSASAPGRGRPDLELVGTGEPSRFGPRPVDPGDLPADELVRVATSVLADDLVTAGEVAGPGPTPPLNRPWRRSYRLVGDPVLADPLRAQLVARGRPPGGGSPRVLVLGDHADLMLADAFEARALDTGGPSWPDWLAILAARDELAPRVDLAGVARAWARRTSPDRVTIVLDPAAVARLAGVRRLDAPVRLSAEAVDLARRVAAVLGLLVTPERRAALLRSALAPRLRGRPGSALAVTDRHREWLAARATRMRQQLRRAGYPVAGGGLDRVLPAYPPGGVEQVADDAVLELATRLLLDGPRAGEGDA
jgi:hypothetical protein